LKESLQKGIKKKKGKIINMIASSLLIRHKQTKIEYTISKIIFSDEKPSIVAYRYYSNPSKHKKVYIEIPMSDFKKYEPV
jgi:hypothetical protein